MRKFENADEEVFKNFVRIYLHTNRLLHDLWVCNGYGDEFLIGKVAFMGQYFKEKTDINYGFLIENNDYDIHFP